MTLEADCYPFSGVPASAWARVASFPVADVGHQHRLKSPRSTKWRDLLTLLCRNVRLGKGLAGQHRDALDVVRQRERVEHPQILNLVAVRAVQADVARE
jgi:hypothetical protein